MFHIATASSCCSHTSLASLTPSHSPSHPRTVSPEPITHSDPIAQSAVKRREANRHAVEAMANHLLAMAGQPTHSVPSPVPASPEPGLVPDSGRAVVPEAGIMNLLHLIHLQSIEINKLKSFKQQMEQHFGNPNPPIPAANSPSLPSVPPVVHAMPVSAAADPSQDEWLALVEARRSLAVEKVARLSGSSSGSISGSGSAGQVEVEVVLARHLPIMKYMSRSTDPYCEIVLLTNTSSNSSSGLQGLVDVEYNVLSGQAQLRYMDGHGVGAEDEMVVLGYQR